MTVLVETKEELQAFAKSLLESWKFTASQMRPDFEEIYKVLYVDYYGDLWFRNVDNQRGKTELYLKIWNVVTEKTREG